MKNLFLAICILAITGCGPARLLNNGYTDHTLFVKSVAGQPEFQSQSIQVPAFRLVIVDSQMKMPCVINWESGTEIVGCAVQTPYAHTVYIKGKIVNGKAVMPPAILGHEVIHLIENAVDVMPVHQYEDLK